MTAGSVYCNVSKVDSYKPSRTKRNVELELYRFVMAILIATLHFSEDYAGYYGPIPGGFLGVDFYFILSGYFLMRSFESKRYGDEPFENTMGYFKGRLARLYPPYIIATMLMLLVTWILGGGGFANLIRQLWDIRWQLICCHFIGMPASSNMRSVWYISTLLILSWFIFFMLSWKKEAFLGIAPVTGILLLAYIARVYGTLGMQGESILIFNGGMVRGFAEMSLGATISHVLREREERNGSYAESKNYIRLTARFAPWFARMFCYALIFGIMRFRAHDLTDFVTIPLFLLLIYIAERYPIGMDRSEVDSAKTICQKWNKKVLNRETNSRLGGGYFQTCIILGRD